MQTSSRSSRLTAGKRTWGRIGSLRANSMKNTKHNFFACKIDMSDLFEDEFVKRCGGRVYMSGVCDDVFNTCPRVGDAIYIHTIDLIPEKYPQTDLAKCRLIEELVTCEFPYGKYIKRSKVERLIEKCPANFFRIEVADEDGSDPMEVVKKQLMSEPVF